MRAHEIVCEVQKGISRGLSKSEAERIALQKQAVRAPGNSQRMWDGHHAELGDGHTAQDNRRIALAIAKRARKGAR
jgi:hypothetical protein